MGIASVMLCDTRMRTRFRCLAIIVVALAIAAPMRVVRAADEAADLARLSLEVQRAEDIRAVKRLGGPDIAAMIWDCIEGKRAGKK